MYILSLNSFKLDKKRYVTILSVLLGTIYYFKIGSKVLPLINMTYRSCEKSKAVKALPRGYMMCFILHTNPYMFCTEIIQLM